MTVPRQIHRCPRCGYSDEDLRTPEQNNLLWARLTAVSEQLKWPVNGKLEYLTPWEWKDVFTAALKQTSRIAAGLDGGFVFIGGHTSRMSKSLMTELLDLIGAFAVQHKVNLQEAA